MNNTSPTPEGSTARDGRGRPSDPSLPGVGGWLRFFVVLRIYVDPPLTTLGLLVSWLGALSVADDYPGLLPVTALETLVAAVLVVRGVHVGIALRDLVPGAVQATQVWLKLCLGWSVVSVPLSFLSGLDPEALVAGAFRGLLSAVIGFAIWYSYFTVSKRVQLTYRAAAHGCSPTQAAGVPSQIPQPS